MRVTGQCLFRSDWNGHICPTRFTRPSCNGATSEAVALVTMARETAVSRFLSESLSGAPGQIVQGYWAGNPMTSASSLAEVQASAGDEYFLDDAGTGALHLRLTVAGGNEWAPLLVTP